MLVFDSGPHYNLLHIDKWHSVPQHIYLHSHMSQMHMGRLNKTNDKAYVVSTMLANFKEGLFKRNVLVGIKWQKIL